MAAQSGQKDVCSALIKMKADLVAADVVIFAVVIVIIVIAVLKQRNQVSQNSSFMI